MYSSTQDFLSENFRDKTFTITEITSIIKDLLEGSFSQIVLEGEISNWKPSSTGHIYFTLKFTFSQ